MPHGSSWKSFEGHGWSRHLGHTSRWVAGSLAAIIAGKQSTGWTMPWRTWLDTRPSVPKLWFLSQNRSSFCSRLGPCRPTSGCEPAASPEKPWSSSSQRGCHLANCELNACLFPGSCQTNLDMWGSFSSKTLKLRPPKLVFWTSSYPSVVRTLNKCRSWTSAVPWWPQLCSLQGDWLVEPSIWIGRPVEGPSVGNGTNLTAKQTSCKVVPGWKSHLPPTSSTFPSAAKIRPGYSGHGFCPSECPWPLHGNHLNATGGELCGKHRTPTQRTKSEDLGTPCKICGSLANGLRLGTNPSLGSC